MTTARQLFGKDHLKAGIVEPERTSIAKKRFGNHVLAATYTLLKVKALSRIDRRFRGNENEQRDIPVTRTRELLLWRGPVAIANDRPVLSSERAPNINKPATVRQ
jgi:hypothetical protein